MKLPTKKNVKLPGSAAPLGSNDDNTLVALQKFSNKGVGGNRGKALSWVNWAEIGRQCGITRSHMHKLRTGKTTPTMRTAKRLSDTLSAGLDDGKRVGLDEVYALLEYSAEVYGFKSRNKQLCKRMRANTCRSK